jgi:rfaE bifunctional protein nucleotidyltransferase chain/domain
MCLIERKNLRKLAGDLKQDGKTIVFTNGCFDLLHAGHLSLLEEASSRGDVLIVGLNDDYSVRRLKGGGRPLYPAGERAEILLAVKWVDYVTIFPEDTPLETIQLINPDVLVKGSEYELKDIVGAKYVENLGGSIVRVRMKKGCSTQSLIEKIMGKL